MQKYIFFIRTIVVMCFLNTLNPVLLISNSIMSFCDFVPKQWGRFHQCSRAAERLTFATDQMTRLWVNLLKQVASLLALYSWVERWELVEWFFVQNFTLAMSIILHHTGWTRHYNKYQFHQIITEKSWVLL